MDDDPDANGILLASPPSDWRRQLGHPGITWLSTVQQDLKQHHLTLPEAADLAQNRPLWRMMSTYRKSCMRETTTTTWRKFVRMPLMTSPITRTGNSGNSLVHQCLQDKATQYPVEYCVPVYEVASHQRLRSASRHQLLMIPRYRPRTLGRQAFAVAGPFWNSLADELRTYSIDRFKLTLKIFLFAIYYCTVLYCKLWTQAIASKSTSKFSQFFYTTNRLPVPL